ncbi:penicillin-binding protein activator LpoB [Bacteroides sp. Marseille-P3684]|uniref:penicillin-binding protein activator LpoB n=1 Tax=Bacteroides sp. Marseille-P3684 TaxID=2086579 RepID=UPI001F4495B6|nr:penicillin-binding protein activator LpoB [Bacteroides sp. Marseille-P3684]
MKLKTLMLTLSWLLGFFTMYGQVKEKPVVFVDYFDAPSNANKALIETLRGKVIEGIQETQRLQVIDVASHAELKDEAERRKSESAMGDMTARTSEMRTLGADYIITGTIATMTATEQRDSDNKLYYKGSIHWTIKVIDAATGTLKTTQTFDHSGFTGSRGDTRNEAIAKTCDYAKNSMDNFVNETFPIEGLILKVETVKKDKAQTVYIDLGNAQGVTDGQRFNVFLETDIAGEIGRTEIGALSAKEVVSAQRTLCKVTKGGKEIQEAFQKGQKLIVISRKGTVIDSFTKSLF